MRIISQDGMIDMPYEQMVININYRNKNQIVANGANCEDIFPVAEYSTEEKAKKAMEMLNGAYMAHSVYMSLETNEKTDFEKEMVKDGFCKEYMYGLFKFPQDSEIEV